jgi:hypothetical protein
MTCPRFVGVFVGTVSRARVFRSGAFVTNRESGSPGVGCGLVGDDGDGGPSLAMLAERAAHGEHSLAGIAWMSSAPRSPSSEITRRGCSPHAEVVGVGQDSGQRGRGELADPDPPRLGALFDWVVVVHQHERFAGRRRGLGREDRRVLVRLTQRAYVKLVVCHRFSGMSLVFTTYLV